MIRFAKAGSLELHLRRLAPLSNQERVPPGNVLYYVLIEQVETHLTVLTLKDINCQGYVRTYLRHDPTQQLEGGPKHQRYLLDYQHLHQRVKMFKRSVILERRRGGSVLAAFEGTEKTQQVKLKDYGGSADDFDQAKGVPLPSLTTVVNGMLWRAACRCIKVFSKPEANADVLNQTNKPLLIISKEDTLRLISFYRGCLQIQIVADLKVDNPLGEGLVLIPLSSRFINRLCLPESEYVRLGYDSRLRHFGLRSDEFECTSIPQQTSGYIQRLSQEFLSKLQSVAKRHVSVAAAQEKVQTCRPERIDGEAVCVVETSTGSLQLFPERNIHGDNYSVIKVEPHPENQGTWIPILVVHEYLTAGFGTLLQLLSQLRLSVDYQPPGVLELLKGADRYVLKLGLSLRDVLSLCIYIPVVTCEENPDLIDVRE